MGDKVQASHLLVKHRWGYSIVVLHLICILQIVWQVTDMPVGKHLAALSLQWLSCFEELWNARQLYATVDAQV